jgi:hypothetical protein
MANGMTLLLSDALLGLTPALAPSPARRTYEILFEDLRDNPQRTMPEALVKLLRDRP